VKVAYNPKEMEVYFLMKGRHNQPYRCYGYHCSPIVFIRFILEPSIGAAYNGMFKGDNSSWDIKEWKKLFT